MYLKTNKNTLNSKKRKVFLKMSLKCQHVEQCVKMFTF